jgi:hypothetical protein
VLTYHVQLLSAVLVSLIFIGIRVIYTLVELVTLKPSLSPTPGSVAVRVLLDMLPELITTTIFIVTGLLTRNIQNE